MRNSIEKSITLTLTDEELMELLRMILDEDEKEAISLLQMEGGNYGTQANQRNPKPLH